MHWHREYRDKANVDVHPFRGQPRQLIDYAVSERRKATREERNGQGRAYDEIWCVFDVDSHPYLNEVETLARAHGISLAVSSPCLELWFVLHFQDQTAYIESHEVQRLSTGLLRCGKALSPAALSLLRPRYETARERAQALDRKHAGDGSPAWSNPSSGTWRVLESIRTA